MASTTGSPQAPDDLRRAKRPRSPLAGPYGHPFHPIAVTIPLGTWTASIVFDIIAFFVDDPEPFVVGAAVLIVVGLVGAVVAAILGLLDLATLATGTPARRTALVHMAINLAVVVIFAIGAVIRFTSDDDEVNVFAFILSLVALAALGVSGWLGGKLSYHYGVRVADEATQAEGFR